MNPYTRIDTSLIPHHPPHPHTHTHTHRTHTPPTHCTYTALTHLTHTPPTHRTHTPHSHTALTPHSHTSHTPHTHRTHTALTPLPQTQSLWRGDQLHPQDWVYHVQCTEHKDVYGDPTLTGGRGNVLNSILLSQGLSGFLTGTCNDTV